MTESDIPAAPAAAKPDTPWFARRFPTHDSRNGMGPVSWQGWACFAAFAGAMIFAGLLFLFLAVAGSILLAVIAFAAVAGGAMIALLALVARKGDTTKTMEEYVKAKNAGG